MLSAQVVVDFFIDVLQQDATAIMRIENGPENAWIDQHQFIFSLQALLQILEPGQGLPMRDFRKLLYSSQINRELQVQGAEISVFHSTGKIDSNLYCLKATR